MDLVFVTEARFHRSVDGKVYSQNGSYGLSLWERYLSVFDKISVLARVENTNKDFPKEYIAESEKVSFIEIPYFVGPLEYLKKRNTVNKVLKNLAFNDETVIICRVPGKIGTIFTKHLRMKNRPYAVEVVGDPWDVFAPGTIKHFLSPIFRIQGYLNLKKTVAHASATLYVNKNQLKSRYPSNKEAYTTNASNVFIPDSSFNDPPKKFRKKEKELIKLIAIGSLAQMYKAPDIVLKTLKELKTKRYKLHLTWLGDGIYKKPMLELANSLGISNIVDFKGNIPTGEPVRKELKEADLFIHVSRTEGLPRAMVEAMSVGLPCIGTKVGGIPELLEEKALIKPDDVEGLLIKIVEFISNPELMNSQGLRNYKEAKEYSDSVLRNRRQEFCREIIKRSAK